MTTTDARPAVATRDDRAADAAELLPVDLDDLADLLGAVLASEGVAAHAEATLQLVSPDAIAELNRGHLGGTGPTDVLSFPIDGSAPGGADWIVGDVVLCAEVAAAQAGDHAGDLTSELALLVVHGGLHLCGWDHAEDDDRDRMWARERQLLEALNRTPPGDPWEAP